MKNNSRNIKGDLEKSLEKAVTTGSLLSLVLMGYLAILREGFETVLFLGTIYGNEMNSSSVFYGGILGLLLDIALTYTVFKGMKNVPLKMFFKITGGLIIIIAAGLLNNMIGIMQDLQFLPILKPNLFDLSFIMVDTSQVGIFFKALFGYTPSPSLIRVASYLAYIVVIMLVMNPVRVPSKAAEMSNA